MKKRPHALVFLLIVIIVSAAFPGQDTTVLSRVKKMYSIRNTNPSIIDTCIVCLKNYLKTNHDQVDARLLLSEIYLKKGDRETDSKKKLEWFTKGEEQAELVLAQDSTNGRAKLWQVSNFSLAVRTKGIMRSLASIPKIREGISRALQLDPAFPKAYAAQGIIFSELPSFLGGNLDSARIYFERGLKLDSNYAGIYIKMGELHILKKEYGEARKVLNYVLAMKNPSDRAEYELINRSDAKRLLEKIKNK